MSALVAFIADELERPVAPAIQDFAGELAARGGAGTVGVLFYGSALRTGATDGLLDFYVLLDDLAAWDAGPLARRGNQLLPPNVEYSETTAAGMTLRAKIAIMTLAQFRDHARAKSLDTTIWARFSQPCGLVWRRDEAAAVAIAEAVSIAARGAGWWAAHLGPQSGAPAEFWTALFSRTYASELRVEGANRPGSIIEAAPDRYAALLPLAWAAEGITFERHVSSVMSGEAGGSSEHGTAQSSLPLVGRVRVGVEPDNAPPLDAGLPASAPRLETPPPLTPPHKGEGKAHSSDEESGHDGSIGRNAQILSPRISEAERRKAEGAWRRRKALAKPLNLARLAKAAFTFSGGVDYIAWKIERHSGQKIEVTPFQRRHPLLAAGPALWRLWRRGVLR